MALEIGMQLPRLVLRWADSAEQAFSIKFKDPDTGDGLTWTGTDTVRLVIDGDQFDATLTAGGFANWEFTEVESDPAYIGKTARLEYLDGSTRFLWAQGTVRAA